MNSSETKRTHPRLCAAVASMLALALLACEQKPPADQVTKDMDRPSNAPAREPTNPAVDTRDGKSDQAADASAKPNGDAGMAPGAGGNPGAPDRPVDDAELAAKVKVALLTEPGLHELKIDTSHGIVTLRGMADSSESRDKAAQIALNVEGVKSVQNNLVITDRS